MRTQRFKITLRGAFQETEGELFLQLEQAEVAGSLRIGDRESYFRGRMLRRNRYAASVRLKTAVYEEDCDMLLRVQEGKTIRGSIMGAWETWTLEGTAEEPSPAAV